MVIKSRRSQLWIIGIECNTVEKAQKNLDGQGRREREREAEEVRNVSEAEAYPMKVGDGPYG